MMPEIADKSHDHPAISILLLCLGWVLNTLSALTAEDVYTWIFRTASLVSLFLIIAINWKKGMEEIKPLFKKK